MQYILIRHGSRTYTLLNCVDMGILTEIKACVSLSTATILVVASSAERIPSTNFLYCS